MLIFRKKKETHRHPTWYQGTIQKVTSNDISFIDLDERSRSHHKVKCHRRGGVCVLWMLLVWICFSFNFCFSVKFMVTRSSGFANSNVRVIWGMKGGSWICNPLHNNKCVHKSVNTSIIIYRSTINAMIIFKYLKIFLI